MADDKGIYPYVPDIIRYYLGEDPLLANVETFRPTIPAHKQHILANLDVAGGQGGRRVGGLRDADRPRVDGRRSARSSRRKIESNPRGYIAQPTICLSQHPTFVDGRLEGRHIDLRPFILYGEEITVMPGGLTRVALPQGSLVVNSSQGGGTKDTWVLHGDSSPRPAPGGRVLRCSAGSPKTSTG